ncbi:hypothetical protein [Ancylobacter lacus]|uniref:hypothetical protein n=1 Tax=Ancylobacter lacus TaxID=2579970 RepID=UPI001BCDFD32|nr:hypothetical protein [Ancylobacter lacus]MBS7538167.1 hypothetical protein [Ancylobacter lacus]
MTARCDEAGAIALAGAKDRARTQATELLSAGPFPRRHLRRWRGPVVALTALVALAAACAVAGFLGLIAMESVLWRLTGWLCCRTTIGIGFDMRLDLFDRLAGRSMRCRPRSGARAGRGAGAVAPAVRFTARRPRQEPARAR